MALILELLDIDFNVVLANVRCFYQPYFDVIKSCKIFKCSNGFLEIGELIMYLFTIYYIVGCQFNTINIVIFALMMKRKLRS